MEQQHGKWGSRLTFILAAVGSAVGLGNAWRFPGLMAVHGGAAFLFAYIIAMVAMGIPLLMMEIALGRKMHAGAISCMTAVNKKMEPVGWAATFNAFLIVTYYAVVFAWVLIMCGSSFKFAGMVGDTEAASTLFFDTIQTTGTTEGWTTIPIVVIIGLVIAWLLQYYCIRDGANSVGKVVKYTVFVPVILLLVMALKGLTMPSAGASMAKLFIPDISALSDVSLWVDAIGQVFYSLSVVMAIMFAYGSYLDSDSNIAADSIIIAFSDMACSLLASIVMYTTMGGVGMLDNMSTSGIATAFIIYPQAIVSLTQNGIFNAIFGFVFYLCLVTLAIDSSFSIIEGVSVSISRKFNLKQRKVTITICCCAGLLSLLYVSGAGLAVLDIVDHYLNQINMILIGILECIAVAWAFDSRKILREVNKNTKKFRMPEWWFCTSLKYISPTLLIVLFCINIYSMIKAKGVYGGYSLASNLIFGWGFCILVLISGFIAKLITKIRHNEHETPSWEEMEELDAKNK